MQEVYNVVEGVLVDVLSHRLAELQFVQLIEAGQTVLGLGEMRFKKSLYLM